MELMIAMPESMSYPELLPFSEVLALAANCTLLA